MPASAGQVGSLGRLDAVRIALAGGGTGGHVVPGLHLLESMQRGGARPGDVLWFGAGRAIEERVLQNVPRLLPGTPFRHVVLELEAGAGGAPGWGRLARRLLPAILHARRALQAHRSQLLVGLGGYTSMPAVLAASSLGLPICLLEINAVRGKATRWLSPLARRVFHAWPSTMAALAAGRSPRHLHVGPPLASTFVGPLPDAEQCARARLEWGFSAAQPLLLVLGGSQGAASLNRFVKQSLATLLGAGVQVLHQVGPGRLLEAPEAEPGYQPLEYIDDMPGALSVASLVLCRGGASTLAELAARAAPSIVVPYPHHRDAHQERNARLLGEGVRIVPDERLDFGLVSELIELIGAAGSQARATMSQVLATRIPRDASDRICTELASLI